MKADDFKNARFVKTAVKPVDFPIIKNDKGHILPEIAVAGRSNVGKSSLLNHLFQAKGLVKTSSTPGKTQAVNFFNLNNKIGFADLPGYGYADVPISVRKQWGPMIQNYLQNREQLQLILFLMDIRREPNAEDIEMINWILHSQKAMILVLTKTDKVNQSEKLHNTKRILEAINLENLYYVYYSTIKGGGRFPLIKMICDALTPSKEDLIDGEA